MTAHTFQPRPNRGTGCVRCGRTPDQHVAPGPEPAHTGRRDPAFERAFIDAAGALGGVAATWPHDVHDRLSRMEREKGTDSYLQFTLPHLLTETDQEGLDLGGWPLLAALVAFRDIHDDEARQAFQQTMLEIAGLGAQVRAKVMQARQMLY